MRRFFLAMALASCTAGCVLGFALSSRHHVRARSKVRAEMWELVYFSQKETMERICTSQDPAMRIGARRMFADTFGAQLSDGTISPHELSFDASTYAFEIGLAHAQVSRDYWELGDAATTELHMRLSKSYFARLAEPVQPPLLWSTSIVEFVQGVQELEIVPEGRR